MYYTPTTFIEHRSASSLSQVLVALRGVRLVLDRKHPMISLADSPNLLA